jgi:tripartite-type tricarboxylate transporter receptor subunit TctC
MSTDLNRRSFAAGVSLLGLGLGGGALAQSSYPNKAITLIVPFAPGGVADITARTVAQAMSASLKQAIVVDNRPSAGNLVGTTAVAQAAADGYTLLLMSNGNAVAAGLFKKLPFDVKKDFAPIGTMGYFDLGVFVSQESRFKTLGEAIAFAKANPGKLNIGTISIGSTQHLSAELFKTTANVNALIVPYKGTPAVLTALRAGEIDLAFEILSPMIPQVQAKAIRALAVTSEKRYAGLPEVPTMQQAGVTPYAVSSWNALAAPGKTPKDVIQKLNAAVNEALKSPAVQERLSSLSVRPQGSTPEQMQELLASEITRWSAVIKTAKIELQ